MKNSLLLLALGLMLLFLFAAPAPALAQGNLTTVYADSTGTVTPDNTQPLGTARNPVKLPDLGATGTANDAYFAPATDRLQNKTGTLVYIYRSFGTTGWCKYPVTNGSVSLLSFNCSTGVPPETGLPIADSVLWIAGLVLALLLVGSGLFLRSRRPALA